jgi:oligoribonuclease
MSASDNATKLLWVDLEMTGLNPQTQRIIEVAAVVTDMQLTEIARYEAIVHQPDSVLKSAEAWPRENMKPLFKEVSDSSNDEITVQTEFSAFIAHHFNEEPAVLAGNSIHQDRRFIRQWWPDVESKLHYRMLDVSSYKIWIGATSDVEYPKGEAHRALQDIQESIAEFQWSLEQLKKA